MVKDLMLKKLSAWTVPRWPVAAQIGGGGAALGGVWMYLGTAATLLIGGVLVAAVGALREAKVI